MKIKTIIILAMFSYTVHAQENSTDSTTYKRLVKFPLFTIDYFCYPASNFNTKTGKGEISVNEWRTSFQVAFPLKERNLYLLNRIEYSLFNYNTTKESSNIFLQETYNSVQYSVGLLKVLPKKWQLIINFSPTLASDFNESLSSDDFIFQASVLAMKRPSKNFRYGFGLAYTSRFGNLTLLPLVNLTYKKDKWLTLAVIPAYVSQFYNFSDNSRLGLKVDVCGNLYNVNFEAISSVVDLNRVSYSRITIGPEYQLKIVGDLYLNVRAGIAVRNILEVQGDKLNQELALNVKNKFFFNLGLKILK
jgi:Domain of unknown function (DUF6268)